MGEVRAFHYADLGCVFTAPQGRAEAVGLEAEVGLIHRKTRRNATYPQTLAFLEDLVREFDVAPQMDGPCLVGVGLPGGAGLTLETGGALEYSSPPFATVADATADVLQRLQQAAGVADRHGIALLTGGITPFTAADDIAWNPKSRVRVMRDYFRGLGGDGAYADEVMGLVLSTQTTLDYTSAEDLMTKLRLLVRAAPVVAALFVDSPVAAGAPTGALSRRMQYWRRFDPRRCGVLDLAFDPGATVQDIVDWAARLPMIYRLVAGAHVPAPQIPFRDAVEHGFGDGTYPTLADWELHLNQFWPHVRVRGTLEVRLPDAPPWPWLGAGAALWTGLVYDPQARHAAGHLLSDLTADEVDRATVDVAVKGLSAMIGPRLVQDVARELLRLARQGLQARVAAGLEPAATLALLDPLDDICDTMRTFADHALDLWQQGEDAYLAAYSVPAG